VKRVVAGVMKGVKGEVGGSSNSTRCYCDQITVMIEYNSLEGKFQIDQRRTGWWVVGGEESVVAQ